MTKHTFNMQWPFNDISLKKSLKESLFINMTSYVWLCKAKQMFIRQTNIENYDLVGESLC